MSAHGSYPEVASRALISIHRQNPSPIYGYLRSGSAQRIYLFPALPDAQAWIAQLIHGHAEPYDYAAIFAASDLARPVVDSYGQEAVTVGQLWPFLLGMPFGGMAGYYLRRWQEQNPGRVLPGLPAAAPPAPHVGGPWLDVERVGGPWLDVERVGGPWLDVERVGGPWLDLESVYDDPWLAAMASPSHARVQDWIGTTVRSFPEGSQRQSWAQTQALIQVATQEISSDNASSPAAAWVWSLDPSGPSPIPGVTLTGTTSAIPFASSDEALDYLRARSMTPHVALALFDTSSPHWPNPIAWNRNDDPAYAPIVEAQVAQTTQTAGTGAPRTSVGSAVDDVRTRAQSLAARRDGDVVGVIFTTKDGLWHTLAFHSPDDADDWFGVATQDPNAYTYAAYYDKRDFTWPDPLNEKIGGTPAKSSPREVIHRQIATTSGWAA